MSTSLSIYLDDCSDGDVLIALLTNAGHAVVSPRDAGTKGIHDPDHLAYAAAHGYVLLTFNCKDFRPLHLQWQSQGQQHAGIFAVYFDNDIIRDMKPHDIVRAIDNLLASGLPIVNEFHILNQWQ